VTGEVVAKVVVADKGEEWVRSQAVWQERWVKKWATALHVEHS